MNNGLMLMVLGAILLNTLIIAWVLEDIKKILQRMEDAK